MRHNQQPVASERPGFSRDGTISRVLKALGRLVPKRSIKQPVDESDPRKLKELLAELRAGGETADGRCIDAERFLDGNEDEGSIGCNLSPHPGMKAFRDVVDRVGKRPDVSAMLVCISEDMGDEFFPFTDSILVCTSASTNAIREEFGPLQPDDVVNESRPDRLPKPADGHRWLYVWWD